MKKIISTVLLIALTLTNAFAVTTPTYKDLGLTKEDAEVLDTQQIYIDDVLFTYDTEKYGHAYITPAPTRIMIPLRAVSEKLGLTVSWDGDTQTASVETAKGTMTLKNGNKYITLGDKQLASDQPVVRIDPARGITYVGIRSYCEALNYKVEWKPGFVFINTDGSSSMEENGGYQFKSQKATSDFKSLPNFMKALEENTANDAYWDNNITGQLHYGYNDVLWGGQIGFTLYAGASRASFDGIMVGEAATQEYNIIFAYLDDVLTAEDAKVIKNFLTTYKDTAGKGYNATTGTTPEAQEYMKSVCDKVYTLESGVKYGFIEYCHIFNVDFPVN